VFLVEAPPSQQGAQWVYLSAGVVEAHARPQHLRHRIIGNEMLAGHDLAIRERQPHHALGPEEPEAIVENEPDEPGHQQERDRQRPSGEPDEGLAPPPRLRQPRAHR